MNAPMNTIGPWHGDAREKPEDAAADFAAIPGLPVGTLHLWARPPVPQG